MRLRNIPGAREKIDESKFCVSDPRVYKGRWHELFGNDNPIHMEIGMGKGKFIMRMAQAHPDINYIGIEMYSSVLVRAVELAEAADDDTRSGNFVFIRMDARELCDVFEKGEAERIYLNFSDPWPKNRYAKRRLSSSKFLEGYKTVLSADGEVQMKTDNAKLFTYSLLEFQNAGFKMVEVDVDYRKEPHPEDVLTEYEEKFVANNQAIYRCVWKR